MPFVFIFSAGIVTGYFLALIVRRIIRDAENARKMKMGPDLED